MLTCVVRFTHEFVGRLQEGRNRLDGAILAYVALVRLGDELLTGKTQTETTVITESAAKSTKKNRLTEFRSATRPGVRLEHRRFVSSLSSRVPSLVSISLDVRTSFRTKQTEHCDENYSVYVTYTHTPRACATRGTHFFDNFEFSLQRCLFIFGFRICDSERRFGLWLSRLDTCKHV